jgi:glycosyltransferase involved in cell wall biosynthesis
MKQLFIFDETSQAAMYGIGTYIREYLACLRGKFQMNLVIFYSGKEEFTVVEKDYYLELHIPKHQIEYIDGKADERFYINRVYLLHDFVDSEAKQIFHFNHVRYSSVIDLLREYYPNCKIVLTIHYFYWCFIIGGNTSYFKEIISKPNLALANSVEKDVNSIFENEVLYFNKTDHLICLSKYTKEILISEYHVLESKISLIYNGLKDEYTFLDNNDKINLKKRLHLPPTDAIILFAGRLDRFKGLDYHIVNWFLYKNYIHG